MNLERLHQLLQATTVQLRKGEELEGTPALVEGVKAGKSLDELGGGVLHVYAMPHESQARPDVEKVDLHFVTIGVDKAAAEAIKPELLTILQSYPAPERLAGGPSYIELGAEIGDQGAALQLFALGQVLGLWTVITPATLGMTGPQADQMAGMGFVMISGFSTAQAA